MRSPASKPLPKKGDLKTSFKSTTAKQAAKKTVTSKKVKKIVGKNLAKGTKKNTSKDDSTNSKKEDGNSTAEKNENSPEVAKPGPSKARSDSPSKKTKPKKDPKEKKDSVKNIPESNVKKTAPKKPTKSDKKRKLAKPNVKKGGKDNNDVKYKINKGAVKKPTPKFSKAKTIVKKGNSNEKKKSAAQTKQEKEQSEKDIKESEIKNGKDSSSNNEETKPVAVTEKEKEGKETIPEKKEASSKNMKSAEEKDDEKIESKISADSNSSACKTPPKITSPNQSETPKAETERPPKFFTSSRSPRMVDIDVKCCKNSKGNLSVSERFLSMKCEPKAEENTRDKSTANNLVSQGPEIDVYTFTEKVDSPKSILSDFRSPVNKNVGRVRPIARVKGTVIDKKTESEKKKYSPHRPIEEVVKQLKANKRSEEVSANQNPNVCDTPGVESTQANTGTEEEKPKPIVSKSYKMVARKSSITGKPFSPQFLDQDQASPSKTDKTDKPSKPSPTKKPPAKTKKKIKKGSISDQELDNSKFALNTKSFHYSSSEESVSESNDDNDTKESSESDTPKAKKTKNKKYKRITDGAKKTPSKELKELSKDSLIDLKDSSALLGNEKPSKRRRKLLSMWSGPKKHRMASLNALAKVHCLYENESRTHMELGLMKTIDRQVLPSTSKATVTKKKETKTKETEKQESTSESEYETKKEKKDESSESSDDNPPQRTLRGVPGIRSAGKYWDPKSSTSSSEESEMDTKKKVIEKKKTTPKASSSKSDSDKPPAKMKKTAGVPVKKKRNRNEVVMDLKDMVVQKRMASLNATAILAASYEKRSPKSNKDETTSDSCSDESFSQKSKNGQSSGFKSELKNECEPKKEIDDTASADRKQKVEVIVNQDTDVTITGVYSTHHHEGFCTVSGMQYRISSTSHTQTTATANCDKEGCSRDEGARYTPLSALSSMQPPADHGHSHPHPVAELGGLSRRAGCSSAFSAPSTASHHEPGYFQPAGPLINKEANADAERALARYHPPPHYHAPHPPVLPQYGPAYYPDLCYGRYYRPPGSYHMPPPQPDGQMVGVGNEPYPPPQYYGTPPCYQHSPQRIPYVEYRGCPCPLNACPKNVLIGPVTGKAPTGGGPADVPSALAPPGGAFRAKVRACALDAVADTHGSGKDPPLEPEPPAAADAPHPCAIPAIGGVSPKRELYDVRDKILIANDIPGPAEALGPPSPARGSAGACAPQPPPVAPRRARLGKAMARRSLAGDDTGLLLSVPQPPLAHHSDADDDVLAISPPTCAPIDLSSSDERSTPLVDVKKENEGPTYAAARKPDAQALREHNSSTVLDANIVTDANKGVKRRYSRPKLEIDMKDTQLEDGCKTNGIGEHVKLQKRRKVSGDLTDIQRTETVTKEPKKKQTQAKRTPKTPQGEKKATKRKSESNTGAKPKKIRLDMPAEEDSRLKNIVAVAEEPLTAKPKNKSALLLDNLIRKNSIDRPDAKTYSDAELNPAELFLSPNENIAQNCAKKTNINNNIVESTGTVNGVRANTIAAVSQLIGKKLAYKNACKLEKVDSKVTHGIKSVLKTPTVKSGPKEDRKTLSKPESNGENARTISVATEKDVVTPLNNKTETLKDKNDANRVSVDTSSVTSKSGHTPKTPRTDVEVEPQPPPTQVEEPPSAVAVETIEKLDDGEAKITEKEKIEPAKPIERTAVKRCKLTNGELKAKNVEKVVKLLVSKRPAIKTDEATLVVEEACALPALSGSVMRRARRRGPHAARRGRRPIVPPTPPLPEPHATPRWSNGWNWDGEHYLSKVYLNNDTRQDRTARCWSRMTHASGDSVARGDCVLLRASLARAQPYVARVASLWENPEDGEMMVSLVWYYRPEHTERGRQPADAPDEVFASRHRDANSVACIEDKCYVLTFNEYCRYRKRLKAAEEGVCVAPSIVPPIPASEVHPLVAPNDSKLPPSVSPELVLFCRKIYDFRSKKIHVPNK
ncbi:histone gene-specific Epigenetic Repressor in late S phase isoform X2 [Anticarsia gemmatalis]|uniref:histone gene-specific Epigenetic Repressor in late S phase isoform X2 n=1 Tax=Anticarsia gemmatalis TaxID=129554 RepID=UPI003F773E6F